MAFTEAAVIAQLDAASTGRTINMQTFIPGAVLTSVYAVGVLPPYAGRSRWCDISSTLTGTTAATAIQNALTA